MASRKIAANVTLARIARLVRLLALVILAFTFCALCENVPYQPSISNHEGLEQGRPARFLSRSVIQRIFSLNLTTIGFSSVLTILPTVPFGMRVDLVNPSDMSFGTAVMGIRVQLLPVCQQ